ncbi:MAG: mobilization protein C [Alphaproteobacteria bacterium]|nr:mobilization protein C [Alphaproteobacteria bacterium]
MPSGTKADRIALLERQKAEITAKLRTLSAQETTRKRKEETRRKIIIGAAVLAHAATDPAFGAQLRGVLGKSVTRPVDRKVVADLLGPKPGS